jgi:hypothetical protein
MKLPGTRYRSVTDSIGSLRVEDFHEALLAPPIQVDTKEASELWAPHTRVAGATDRKRSSVEQVTALVLDYDTPTDTYYDLVIQILGRVNNIEAYVYRTFTSPRFRVVLPFDTAYAAADYSPKAMTAYVASVLRRLRLDSSGLDRSKLAPESIFYLPSTSPTVYFEKPKRLKAPRFAKSIGLAPLVAPIQSDPDPAIPLTHALLADNRDRLPSFFRPYLDPEATNFPYIPEGKRHNRVYAELRALAPFLRDLHPTPDALATALVPFWGIVYPEGHDDTEIYNLCRDALRNPDALPFGCRPLSPVEEDPFYAPAADDPLLDDAPPLPYEATVSPEVPSLHTIPKLGYFTKNPRLAFEYFLAHVHLAPGQPPPELPPTVDPLHAYHLRLSAYRYREDMPNLAVALDEVLISTLNEKGKPKESARLSPNFLYRVMQHHPASYAALRYDVTAEMPYNALECRHWSDDDDMSLLMSLTDDSRRIVPYTLHPKHLQHPVQRASKENPIDPFVEYMEACYALYNGTVGFDTRDFLGQTFKVEDIRQEEQHLECLHRWLRGVIARRIFGDAVHIVPVFEGGQGIGKSRSMKIMFGSNYVTDLMVRDWTNRDALMNAMGSVVVEIPELNGIDPNDLDKVEALKAFVTSEVDTVRLPYDRRRTQKRRTFSMYATTNRLDGYLPRDRRFMPIPLVHVDQAKLYQHRDLFLGKLYAEVVSRDLTLYPTTVSPDEPLGAFVRDEVGKRAGAPYWIGILEAMLYETDSQRRVDRTRPRYRSVTISDLASRVSEAARKELGTAKIGQVCRQYLSDEWTVTNHGGRPTLSYRGTFITSEDKHERIKNN